VKTGGGGASPRPPELLGRLWAQHCLSCFCHTLQNACCLWRSSWSRDTSGYSGADARAETLCNTLEPMHERILWSRLA